jgi:hypothetical protein
VSPAIDALGRGTALLSRIDVMALEDRLPAVVPWEAEPQRLWSGLDMIRLYNAALMTAWADFNRALGLLWADEPNALNTYKEAAYGPRWTPKTGN